MTVGVVAHEYGTLGQETGQVTEGKFLDLSSLVAEELGAAAVGKGVLGDAFVGQGGSRSRLSGSLGVVYSSYSLRGKYP